MLRLCRERSLICRIDARVRAVLVVVLAGALVAGCSAARFAYERLDWIARWEAGRYVSLTREQKVVFNDGFEDFWRWHRRHELPLWIGELRALAQRTDQPFRRADMVALGERIASGWQRTGDRLMPIACTLGPQLSDAQAGQFVARVDKRIEEFRRKEVDVDPERAREDTVKDIEKTLRRWIGPPTEAQRALVHDWAQTRPGVAQDWLAYRERWRAEAVATLEARQDPRFCERITVLLARSSEIWSEAEDRAFKADRERWIALFEALSETLTPAQRKHLRERLLKLADDLEAAGRQTA